MRSWRILLCQVASSLPRVHEELENPPLSSRPDDETITELKLEIFRLVLLGTRVNATARVGSKWKPALGQQGGSTESIPQG
ncbi:hypothetical protein RRG08_050330 [Elysia crispata]|uniref:Uncharacterized protein n=1 Tax=Elysia crispata TaxID=231223 RepID=A0AAE1A0G1_9GAST|nr:hypothetical protein RRG08_050330 [Elysia crispata]